VVHVFSASYWSFLLAPVPAMLAARLFGKRVVLHYHSGEAADHLANWGWRVHPWMHLADEIVVPSDYLRGIFAQHGYVARVIPNVVDMSRFETRRSGLLRPRLLSTRNLEPYYDVANTLRAYALVKDRYPNATLTVAGFGSEEGRLRRLAKALEVDVDFLGRVEPEAMPALCADADIFVNASVVDNQPLSILEAFAAGLLVVSTPTGAIAEMVRHEQNGLLVPARNPSAMARTIEQILEQPDAAAAMIRCARRDMVQYSWPAVRAAWAEAYGTAAGLPREALT
jgi:L-malate glycosyltransferase